MGQYGLEQVLYRGVGCKACEGSGYSGRTSMVEILEVNGRIKDAINSGASASEITKVALEEKVLRTMTYDALWHLSQGHTDLAEISPYITIGNKAAVETAPAAAAPQPAVAPAEPPAAALAAAGKPRVMIAEDDAVMRMLLKKFIEGAGYAVAEAADGEAALTAIAEGAPDLLVTDINMPRMNGLELVKGVRETLGLSDLPIIMLTTESSDKSQELAFKLGADDYIIKPFKANLVMARISAALRRAGKIK